MAASIEALIVEFAFAPTPPSSPPSPLSLLSSLLPKTPSPPLHTRPTYADAPLGYRETIIQLRAASPPPVPSPPLLLPSADRRESSTAAAARQAGDTLARRVDYKFIDTVDASIRASKSRVMTTVEEVNERVTDLATTQRQDAHELYVHDEDAQDDQALHGYVHKYREHGLERLLLGYRARYYSTRGSVIFMDMAYGRRWIRNIRNYEYAFSCEDLALIRRISFPGYGVLVRNE
ncbi:hypothetical protein Tco_0655580 [Tanacetum coccineum]|uniref:Uncharacterized protein n=1 Tax=Tanacetum coccineum TaxID=301880 RepID=A0ABQ4X7J9_9ASTR